MFYQSPLKRVSRLILEDGTELELSALVMWERYNSSLHMVEVGILMKPSVFKNLIIDDREDMTTEEVPDDL